MNILIIGGTVFLGRFLVESLLQNDHRVTIFHRGKSNPGLFPQVEELFGNRDRELDPLHGRTWDAVIDTCGYVPRVVRQSAALLSGQVGHYTFISSLSVYADNSQTGIVETASTGRLEDETVEEITGETYGPLKALCENVVLDQYRDQALIVRPGLIVGPYDPSDRFTYWPYRVSLGGEVLAPGRPGRPIQFIDVRDLAEWTVRMVENRTGGIFNANGPEPTPSMQDLLHACQAESGSGAALTWVNDEFLVENNVGPWMEMPVWLPENDPDTAGFFAFDSSKAIRQGLIFRPVPETVRATLEWIPQRPDRPWRAGITREREQELLEHWHARMT